VAADVVTIKLGGSMAGNKQTPAKPPKDFKDTGGDADPKKTGTSWGERKRNPPKEKR